MEVRRGLTARIKAAGLGAAAYIVILLVAHLGHAMFDGASWSPDPPSQPPAVRSHDDADAGPFPRDSQPVTSPASWITADDYPAAAIRGGVSGMVVMRFTVEIDGSVGSCTILRSSGSALLDTTSCRLIQDRARYHPARDANGHTVAQSRTQRLRWVLPND